MRKFLSYSFLIFIFLSSNISNAVNPKEISSISNNLSGDIQEYLRDHFLNATFLFADGEKILAKGAKGLFSLGGDQLRFQQEMPIASATKPMTAALILKLHDKKLLNVKDVVAKHLNKDSGIWKDNVVPAWANQITVHQLLTHTSGLAEYVGVLKFPTDKGHNFINSEIANFIAVTKLASEPGKIYNYCNSNYFLLGLIIEKAHKAPLETVMKQEIFDKIGMPNTHLASLDEALKMQFNPEYSIYPQHYFLVPNGTIKPKFIPAKVDFVLVPFADGGVISTALDMLTWHRALHRGKVLSKESYNLMITPHIQANDNMNHKNYMGYGMMITHLKDKQVMYHHPGSAVGIRTESGYVPSKDLYFAILSNVMFNVPKEHYNKIDFTQKENQLDIGFFRKSVLSSMSNVK